MFRFLFLCLKACRFHKTLEEMEWVFVKHDQETEMGPLLRKLTMGQRPDKYGELQPFLDEKGMVRINSGINSRTAFTWELKRPLLITAAMRFAKDLTVHLHENVLHHQNGVEGLLVEVRKRFWMMGARRLAKQTITKCIRCAKKKWLPLTIPMPPFNPTRTSLLRAFSEIGVDHAGPFHLRQGRSVVEGHVLVISCCATRAVSLEMSMSTGATHVLAGLQRHIGVYGSPRYIYSDQGTGFVRAKKLVEQNHEYWWREGWEVYETLDWRLNPPYSPTWSGHVESMVKLTKRALERMHVGPTIQKLTPDEFYTLLKRAQGYINSRPLVRPDSGMPLLTPGDLIGTGASQLVNLTWPTEDCGNIGYRYKQLEEVRKDMLVIFRDSYIGTLRRQRSYPLGALRSLQEGDLVVASDVPDWSGNCLPVAKVVKVMAGMDGGERVFELEMVPDSELYKEPKKVGEKYELQLRKKKIIRNHCKIGLLPTIVGKLGGE